MALLTVIIPTHNRAACLERTLSTLARQSKKDFKIIVVDHGSTDNTEAVSQKYQDILPLKYYWIPRADYFAPGIPRDFGVKQADTSFIVFLDADMVVSSSFVAAHLAFLQSHKNHVGMGYIYGSQGTDHFSQSMAAFHIIALFHQFDNVDNVDEIVTALVSKQQVHDSRAQHNLKEMSLPWTLGWTGNLSMPTEAYREAGGFDLNLQGWGFEDLDLSYRLYKQGYTFAFVKEGWGLELPQPHEKRPGSGFENIRRSYEKQRTLALESLLYGNSFAPGKSEVIFPYLAKLGRNYPALFPEVSSLADYQFAHPSLLIGGTRQAALYDYVALADEDVVSSDTLWSCSGIISPLADRSLATVVVSDVWKSLGLEVAPQGGTLLDHLIPEIKRTAQEAFFLDTPSLPLPADCHPVSMTELVSTCRKYDLPFQVISRA